MSTQVQVVYPSTSSASGSGQLDLGPFYGPDVVKLLRAEVHGKTNSAAVAISTDGIEANYLLWALQWVPTGDSPANIITTADGPNFLMRRQLGSQDSRAAWTPTSDPANYIHGYAIDGEWGGQLPIGQSIDFYLSFAPPSGASVNEYNLFASMRWWWH